MLCGVRISVCVSVSWCGGFVVWGFCFGFFSPLEISSVAAVVVAGGGVLEGCSKNVGKLIKCKWKTRMIARCKERIGDTYDVSL